jgi:hypothetical protein
MLESHMKMLEMVLKEHDEERDDLVGNRKLSA